MEEVTRAEQERLLKLLRKHRKRLKGFPNVRTVDVGYEFRDGRPTGRLAIRAHVTAKQPEAELKRLERLPEELEGVPVDVIESNPELHAVNRDAHQDPVIGGVTLGNPRSSLRGTLGAVVFDRRSLQPMALSNYHVLVVEPPARTDTIAQPKTSAAADVLGSLERWNKQYDCAVCRIVSRGVSTELADLGVARGVKYPQIGTKVVKSGRSTAVTRGLIDGTDGEEFTVVPDSDFPAPMGEISRPGDSGSLWLDSASLWAVGLHYAGESDPDPAQERAWAKWMAAVVDKLSILLLDTAAMGAAHTGWSCTVLGRTRPNAPCRLDVVYPSGRNSTAKGLGDKTADADGWVRWNWTIGTSTKRHGAGTGAPLGIPVKGFVTLDGTQVLVTSPLEGRPTT
ncbi:MAG: hypothetical protein M3123_05160 [Actinomycetota bacterium]|nr:hypothetical protein [Actinomycetota bacterium]